MDKHLTLHLRWRGFLFLFSLLVVSVIYFGLIFDWHVKFLIENYLTSLNGAQVNITSIKTRLTAGTLEAKGVQITDLRTPTKNLFEIDRISCRISFIPLLRKKFVMEGLEIQGVHTGTAREFPGLLPIEVAKDLPTSIADRVANGLYSSLRAQINENPLKLLGQLSVGMNLRELIAELSPNLPSIKAAADLESNTQVNTPASDGRVLAALSQSIQRLSAGSAAEDSTLIQNRFTEEKSNAERVVQGADAIEKDVESRAANVSALMQKDLTFLRTKLALPNLEIEDLTPSIIGPKFLEWMERLSYWVDLTRRRMPSGVARGPFWTIVQPRQSGHSVHFGKHAGTPFFLIQRAEIRSESTSMSRLGKVEGVLYGLTSDPSILGNPTVLQVNASFPSTGIETANLGLEIDHTQKAMREKVKFAFEIDPFENFYLSDVGDLKLKILSAKVQLDFTGEFSEDEIKIEWKGVVSNVKYSTSSRYKQIEAVVSGIVTPISSFDISGELKGPTNDLKFTSSSGLGHLLAQGLKAEFRHQLGAIDDMIQQNLRELIAPAKQRLDSKMLEIRGNKRAAEHNLELLNHLQSKLASAEDTTRTARNTKKR